MMEPANLGEKYEIVREIKQGGFGIVYYGYDRHLEKPIAVKEISPSLVKNPKYIDMFQAEARNIARFSHHNIVHVYDLKRTEDGRFYIIMEYIDGLDLEKILKLCRPRGRPLPHRLGAHIVAELCLALDYAHTRRDATTNEPLRIVHQDVSPSNIMISKTGEVKLIDFGIATVRRYQREETHQNSRPGKMPYMSPEMFAASPRIDHRSDIFALGLVLYETLTGRRLFKERDDLDDLSRGSWRFRGRYLRGHSIPNALERILTRALEVDPERRYQSANQMYIDLLQFLITSTDTGRLSAELGDLVRELMDEQGGETAPKKAPVEARPVPEKIDKPVAVPGPSGAPEAVARAASDSQYQAAEPAIEVEEREFFPFEEDLLSMAEEEPERLPPFPFEKAPPQPRVDVDKEGEDDIKTVIDIVRLSARSHKREIVLAASGFLIFALVFLIADTAFRWTSVGTGIFDWLFPPAIRVVSVPAQAQVFLNDEPLPGRTPVDIDEISPGVHRIRLEAAGFPPIERSIQVPRKGAVTIEGEQLGKRNTYVFHFKTFLKFDSQPRGAEVRVNRVVLNRRTPCRVAWEVGVPVSVEMYRAGFEPLTGLTLDPLQSVDDLEGPGNWTITKSDTAMSLSIAGVFEKRVRVVSVPVGASIFVDGRGQAVGVTGSNSEILLTAGTHRITLRRPGFLPAEFDLNVDETSPSSVTGILRRRVRITAQDATDPMNRDIGAELVRLIRNGSSSSRNESTPFEITLLPYPYEAIFKKDGYYQTSVRIPAEVFEVVVEMEPVRIPVQVIVVDAAGHDPIPGAALSYRSARSVAPWVTTFEATDANGRLTWSIAPGDYVFRIEKEGYLEETQELRAERGESYSLRFTLQGITDGRQSAIPRPQQ